MTTTYHICKSPQPWSHDDAIQYASRHTAAAPSYASVREAFDALTNLNRQTQFHGGPIKRVATRILAREKNSSGYRDLNEQEKNTLDWIRHGHGASSAAFPNEDELADRFTSP